MAESNGLNITQQWAQYYASRDWLPLPVKPRSKEPDLGVRWQDQTDIDSNIAKIGPSHNIGINLGKSGPLTDIDLDCDEARLLAGKFLPVTGCIFGRQTAPMSHWLYACLDAQSRKYVDPDCTGSEKSMLLEIRATGQTVFPPSLHKDTGEQILWMTGQPGELQIISIDELESAVGRLASAALLARHLKQGVFHDATVALAGALLRMWNRDYTEFFILTVGEIAGMKNLEDRRKVIRDTASRIQQGENVSGWPSLKNYLPHAVVDKVMEWLNVSAVKAREVFSSVDDNTSNVCTKDIEIHSWGALSKKQFTEMKWIIDTLLPPGISLFVGRPKQGKSWLVHAIGLLVAAGRPVFGLRTEKSEVIYMALEDSERRLQGRTRKLMQTHALTDTHIQGFNYCLYAPRLGENLEESIQNALNARSEVRLVIIDVLTKIRTGRKGNQSVYEYDYEVGNRLKEISKSYPDVAILVVHHQNKGQGDALDSISGTHGLAGGFDNTFALINSSGGMELHINGRDIENSDPIPLRKGADGMWTLESRSSANDVRNSDTRNQILGSLRSGDSTPKEISLSTGIDTNTIHSSLHRMCEQGILEKIARGKYSLPVIPPVSYEPPPPHTNHTK